jgi:predicted unusual protein kinase regulating ubiquinone biosynthesis (AarF/ABC1/UbiB family)
MTFLSSAISFVLLTSSSSSSSSSFVHAAFIPKSQSYSGTHNFNHVQSDTSSSATSATTATSFLIDNNTCTGTKRKSYLNAFALYSTIQNKNNNSKRKTRRKGKGKKRMNNHNHNRNKHVKTYKEIKEEKRQLQIMRDALSSTATSAASTASASSSKNAHVKISPTNEKSSEPKTVNNYTKRNDDHRTVPPANNVSNSNRARTTASTTRGKHTNNGKTNTNTNSNTNSNTNQSKQKVNKQQKQSPQKQKQDDMRQRIQNIQVIRTSLTREEEKRSSDRITKAHQLLDDLTTDPSFVDDDNEGTSSRTRTRTRGDKDDKDSDSDSDNNEGGTSTSTSVRSEMNGSKKSTSTDKMEAASSAPSSSTTTTYAKTKSTKKSTSTLSNDDNEDETKTVPDTYWYNGNLQEGKGDYVTRWARGMKVAEPLRKYDPIAAEKLLFRQPTKWLVRNIQIGFPLALWVTGVIYDIGTNQEESNRKNRAKQLLQTISGLGPAIIKGGQALASRSDLMPSEYLEELQKLQDDVPRFKNELAFDTVEKELGVDFDSIFELIGTDPIAAASIGQVYKARLRTNGDLVALKIQRPNCEDVIALDLYVLRWWSGVANVLTTLLNRDIDVQNIIDDFGELIYRELDYVAEAANAQRFSELYANQVKDVFVPKVYSELTTSKVLTMEWVEGFRLTDIDSLEKYGLDRKKLVDTLVQCSLRQILGNGFFHADPHGGNLLVVPDGRLCYLDFGMMSYAAGPQRNGFLLAVVHIVNRDWDELVSMYQRLGFIPEGTDLKPIAVALEKSLPDALNSDISELNFKNVVGKLGDIMYTYPFSLPPFYISIIRCLGVLEGLAIQVDPQARIISEAYPYVASRVLTDTQGELQEALRRLALTSDGKVRWNRLERLLSEARDSQGYDVSIAVKSLTDYLISDDGEQLLSDFTDQIVDGVDSLSSETISYIVEASRALSIQDEVAAVRAFRTLEMLFQSSEEDTQQTLEDYLSDVLPAPTPSMKQFGRITTLLGARGSTSDPSKLVPIVRRLSQEPKIQRVASEIVAKLGERILSRSLRAVFGLPPNERKGSR